MSELNPAWTRESVFLQLPDAPSVDTLSPQWALENATGAGVRVAVVDSGVDADHPLLGGSVDADAAVDFSIGEDGEIVRTDGPHGDVFGHGTACAGIIHSLAPQARITSVRVLGPGLRGKAAAFHAGLSWAVEEGFDVINLSLGAGKRDWALPFHEICDRAYFNNCFIVTAANNIKRASFPSLYAAVTSVACHTSDDPHRFHFNPEPPTEFLARGIDVEVPWTDGGTTVTTGNSFAAPHIAGFASLIKSKHPELRPFHVKAALWACSANVREATTEIEAAGRGTIAMSPVGRGTIVMGGQSVQSGQVGGAAEALASSAAVSAAQASGVQAAGDAEKQDIEAALPHLAVGELIARGPWGPVYAAQQDERRLAVRRLDPALASDPAILQRFVASVRMAATLQHDHVLPIDELLERERFALLVMPQGVTNLGDVVAPIDPRSACAVGISALRGLDAAHRVGVFHGDLRRANLLTDANNRVMISDVGIAAALTSAAQTGPGSDPNAWTTLAPEQLSGGAVASYTDVHAVGLVLFELLSGQLPFDAVQSLPELLRQRGATPPRRLTDAAPDLDAGIVGVVERSVQNRPPDRWLTPRDFELALLAAADSAFGPTWIDQQPYLLERAQ